ncbi:biotin synthase BioB [Candidatus Ruminimicrobiellum ovillum]|uniref:biotin synthase BioB n=1 Tax=Candidatus Ruminimicrobiellum ovillum TaxID=1947927 RepID=UPI00355A0AC9
MLKELSNKILNENYHITKQEAISLIDTDLQELSLCAEKIKQKFCGNKFDMCSIVSGKSGKCSENCKFCAQSSHYKTSIKEYPLLDSPNIFKEAKHNADKKVKRFSIVTSGKKLSDTEIDSVCQTYKDIKNKCDILLCASMGLLSYEQLVKLKQAGVTRYHCNLETSRRFFPSICSTHTYDDKINTINLAKKAGLEICSGGIFGLGETFEDRIDMFFDIYNLGIKSVPVNVLNPIKGTPFENNKILSQEEINRTVAIARFILPDAFIRLAGGRLLFKDKGVSMFSSGANATITGDMLTTSGTSIDEDFDTIKKLGFEK